MLNKLKRSFKAKKDPQQFLQCGIGENKFKMILLNEPNPQINAPEEKPHFLPSGFKPISASTPKRSRESFKIIEEPSPVLSRVSPAPRLKMSQFIGQIPQKNARSSFTSSPFH
ncbi:uncharacterized protein LOC129945298 [Eupeodes corollae]|uniref:uncharacterized protein LOC129945298 n=1 Tax=Eupeodes corollae TaxID=290404 RepID=UPI002491EED1|nr:uncharacterized protein LOC129945298 [Eupeodes corollae]